MLSIQFNVLLDFQKDLETPPCSTYYVTSSIASVAINLVLNKTASPRLHILALNHGDSLSLYDFEGNSHEK
ncbi:Methylxanthine N1-demethylase NdmA [Frankliniella fusca]|uniref:Methylxanthine N1-demethylase NdmA n=1 Tax=Frankliniella fusca TaxID=407009 RepID=A0AAE1HX18_9NEOP|nr:Methylxanthine N1-demethylase NdmA [Frankliniella fusca]